MAWIFEKSPLWRSIVARTRDSPVFYAGFGVACFAVPYALGKAVMWGTNPDVDPVREELLRRRQTVHNQVGLLSAMQQQHAGTEVPLHHSLHEPLLDGSCYMSCCADTQFRTCPAGNVFGNSELVPQGCEARRQPATATPAQNAACPQAERLWWLVRCRGIAVWSSGWQLFCTHQHCMMCR